VGGNRRDRLSAGVRIRLIGRDVQGMQTFSCAAMELKIEGVSKTYPNGVRALKDVTLAIPAGMYGLLGPNGAGKSTLMRILATLQEPDEGSARLGEIDVVNQKDAIRRTLAYMRSMMAVTSGPPLMPPRFVPGGSALRPHGMLVDVPVKMRS
jgi:ABC-type Mn2+/Zn2+ transport system ATPase subunit